MREAWARPFATRKTTREQLSSERAGERATVGLCALTRAWKLLESHALDSQLSRRRLWPLMENGGAERAVTQPTSASTTANTIITSTATVVALLARRHRSRPASGFIH